MHTKAVLAGAVILICAGCAAGTGQPAASHAGSTAPTTAETAPSATTKTATVAQYASVVAEQRSGYYDTVDGMQGCLGDEGDPFACSANALSASFEAQTLAIVLRGADNDIGQPPAEIAQLVADTINAADAVELSQKAWGDLDCPGDDECQGAWFTADRARSDLKRKLDAWDPYL